jgi:predicted transcriptional regulator
MKTPGRKKAEPGSQPGLGDLETDVMKVIWGADWVAVRDVYEKMLQDRDIAYTTVMTVMTRLGEKGLLDRRQEGRTYLYKARQSQKEVARGLLRRILDRLFDGRRADAVASLLEEADHLEEDELEAIRKTLGQLDRKDKSRGR